MAPLLASEFPGTVGQAQPRKRTYPYSDDSLRLWVQVAPALHTRQ